MRFLSLLCMWIVLCSPLVAWPFPVTRTKLAFVPMRKLLYDVTVISKESYEKGKPQTKKTLGTYEFAPVPAHSTDCVHMYRHDSALSTAIMVVFRGTKLSIATPLASAGDLFRDAQGALTLTTFQNPLTKVKEPGKAGTGFQWRASIFMTNHGTHILHEVTQALADGRRVEIVFIGHSLGGIAAQLASLELAQAIAVQHPDHAKDRIVVSSFALNPPVGADTQIAGAFQDLIVNHNVNSVTIPRHLDPVSESRLRSDILPMDNRLLWLPAAFTDPKDVYEFKNHYLAETLKEFDPYADVTKLDATVKKVIDDAAANYETNIPPINLLPVSGSCGDGVINPGEECDDGTANITPGLISTGRGCIKTTCKLSKAFINPSSCPTCTACSGSSCTE
jgi:pimeloyl-ACP methyl ester carboxylesterase